MPFDVASAWACRIRPEAADKIQKLKPDAIVIQELYREPLGLRELFGRKPFLPQVGQDPHWLLEPYRLDWQYPVADIAQRIHRPLVQ